MIKRICENCKKEYYVFPYRIKVSKYCSVKCRAIKSPRIKKGKFIKCKVCNKRFYAFPVHLKIGKKKFCSWKCSHKYFSDMKSVIKQCMICGKQFKVNLSKHKIGQGKYCSRKCFFKSEFGKKRPPFSKKWIENLSKSHIGIHISSKTKKKLSFINTGSKHPQWKGGKIICKTWGYVFIKQPNHPFCNKQGYVREHRLVVEKQIGRYLFPKEKTHHLGAKDDNRPQMLMAFINNGIHMKFHYNPSLVKPSEIIFDGRNYHS